MGRWRHVQQRTFFRPTGGRGMNKVSRALAAAAVVVCLGAPVQALAAAPSQAQIDQFATTLADFVPIGRVMDDMIAKDPRWPLNEKVDAVSGEQLACMRSTLSTDGFRRTRAQEVAAYAKANPTRFDSDLKMLQAAAPILSQAFNAGVAEGKGEKPFNAGDAMKSATPDQLLSFITFIADPKYAPLRELTGIGDAFDPTRSAEENKKAGSNVGALIVSKLMLGAMKTCDVSPAALF
ncbi:MAG TPA: hypothetical protein VGD42_17845 [Lysobacter sp.]